MPRHFGWNAFAFGFGPRGFWGGPRGGGRRRQWFESGDMKYVILKLVKDKPRHGYEVMKELEDQMHGCYSPSPGTVYPTLQWLEDEGLVVAKDVEGKKVYEITDAGRKFLDEHRAMVDDIFDNVREGVDRTVGGAMGDVKCSPRLAGLLGEDAVQPVTHLEDLARLDLDVAGRAAGAARRLVQQEAGVRQAVAVFARHRDVDQRRDARHPPRADHPHPRAQEAHQVVNRVPRFHVAALRVDEHGDLLARLAGQREQLRHHARGHALGDLAADDHGARAKQPLCDEVVRRCGGRFQGGRRQLFHRLSGVGGHRETPTYLAALRRCRSSSSARVPYTRVIRFRQDRSQTVLSI